MATATVARQRSVARRIALPRLISPTGWFRSDRRPAVGPRRRKDPAMAGTAAGWYYDPDDLAIYRYWDGRVWTDHRSDLFPSSAPSEVEVR